MFDHEKFEAYQHSLTDWEVTIELLSKIPPGNSVLKDQLKRAASSVSLNIAEGSGRAKPSERKHFYSVARGSAMECAAVADLVLRTEPNLHKEVAHAKTTLHSIVCILSKIILK